MFASRLFSKASRAHLSTGWRALAIAGASAAIAAGSMGVLSAEELQKKNRRLGDHHRISISAWSIVLPRTQPDLDATSKKYRGNFESLLWFLKESGYEGIEIAVPELRLGGYFPDHVSDEEIVSTANWASAKTGVKVIGALLHIADGGVLGLSDVTGLNYQNPDFWKNLEKVLALEKSVGSEYITFQIGMPAEMNGTGGAYRNDEEFLRLTANRIAQLQKVCFKYGMNFYVETHIERISEDPEAFCKIFDYCPVDFEVNADLSHYLYRNISRGPHFDRIMGRVGHCHIRTCRKHGDLCSDVGVHFDRLGPIGVPAADWADKGVTWQAVEAMRPALERGLSSCHIVGEAGPAQAVQDALLLDTKLVPLYHYMASIADGGHPAGNPFTGERHDQVRAWAY